MVKGAVAVEPKIELGLQERKTALPTSLMGHCFVVLLLPYFCCFAVSLFRCFATLSLLLFRCFAVSYFATTLLLLFRYFIHCFRMLIGWNIGEVITLVLSGGASREKYRSGLYIYGH